MTRRPPRSLKPSERHALATRLRELWLADPLLTLEQARAATGAPNEVAKAVRQRLVDAGLLQAHLHGRRA